MPNSGQHDIRLEREPRRLPAIVEALLPFLKARRLKFERARHLVLNGGPMNLQDAILLFPGCCTRCGGRVLRVSEYFQDTPVIYENMSQGVQEGLTISRRELNTRRRANL